jgi:hypothetical protein
MSAKQTQHSALMQHLVAVAEAVAAVYHERGAERLPPAIISAIRDLFTVDCWQESAAAISRLEAENADLLLRLGRAEDRHWYDIAVQSAATPKPDPLPPAEMTIESIWKYTAAGWKTTREQLAAIKGALLSLETRALAANRALRRRVDLLERGAGAYPSPGSPFAAAGVQPTERPTSDPTLADRIAEAAKTATADKPVFIEATPVKLGPGVEPAVVADAMTAKLASMAEEVAAEFRAELEAKVTHYRTHRDSLIDGLRRMRGEFDILDGMHTGAEVFQAITDILESAADAPPLEGEGFKVTPGSDAPKSTAPPPEIATEPKP